MKSKFWGLFLVIVVIGAICTVVIVIRGKKPVPAKGATQEINIQKAADPKYAESLLTNLAGGMIALSVKKGGGGNANFTSDISDLKPYIMQKALCALPGEGQTSYGGYIVRLEEYPAGDAFKTNFRLVAYPAEGYIGKVFVVDKKEQPEEMR